MTFTTAEIISAGLGILCCDMDRMYVVFNFLTGDNLFTHQLPRAFHACKAWITSQHPWLNELDADKCSTANWRTFLADAERRFGKTHNLEPLPAGQWLSKDPVSEAVELMEDKDRVITIIK